MLNKEEIIANVLLFREKSEENITERTIYMNFGVQGRNRLKNLKIEINKIRH